MKPWRVLPLPARRRIRAWLSSRLAGEPQAFYRRLDCGFVVKVGNSSDWHVYNEVFVDGVYDAAITATLASNDADLLVVDVGANVGMFAARFLDCAHAAPRGWQGLRLLLVEGSPAVAAELSARIANQPAALPDIDVVAGLAGERSGTGVIHETEFSARNSTSASHHATAPAVARTVTYIDLDRLTQGRRVALLKVDVEGAEAAVLRTYAESLLSRTERLVVEWHPSLVDVAAGRELVSASGLVSAAVRSERGTILEFFTRPASRQAPSADR